MRVPEEVRVLRTHAHEQGAFLLFTGESKSPFPLQVAFWKIRAFGDDHTLDEEIFDLRVDVIDEFLDFFPIQMEGLYHHYF